MRRIVDDRGLATRILIESAGMGGWHVGDRADSRSRTAAHTRGYLLDRRAQQFKRAFFARFDYVLAADSDNRADLLRLAPDPASSDKVHFLRDFDPESPRSSDVPDPYYGGPEGFELVLDICEAACRGLLEHLVRELEP